MEYGLETLVADLQTKIQDLEKENAELKAKIAELQGGKEMNDDKYVEELQ